MKNKSKYATYSGRRQRGFVLPMVMIISLILSIVGFSLLRLGVDARLGSERYSTKVEARTAADAGLAVALYQMNRKLQAEETWDNSNLPAGDAIPLLQTLSNYSYKVTGDPVSGFTIESIGVQGGTQHRVIGTLRAQSVFGNGISTKNGILLAPNSVVDGYNSITKEINLSGEVGTNSTSFQSVIVASGTTVKGDIAVGVGGVPSSIVRNHGTVQGEIYAMSETIPFPTVTAPDLKKHFKDISADGKTVTLNPKDSGTYSNISVNGNGAVLKIVGGDVVLNVTRDIRLGQDTEICISPGATLTLYLSGDLEAKNDSGINNLTKSPQAFTLYGTGTRTQEIDLKAKGEFYGAVYAPKADMTVYANGDIYGSFVSNTLAIKSHSNLHYDHALAAAPADTQVQWFELAQWEEGSRLSSGSGF